MTLHSALEHYRRQQLITAAGLLEAQTAAKRGPLAVARVLTAYQIVAAQDALTSIPAMLAEQGIPDSPVGTVAVSNLAGRASDGRPLVSLLEQASSDTQRALMVATQLQDAARVAAGMGIAARPNVGGYARMLVPPSCSRCAILAGKFFKWNTGFQRHPRCDCRHIPTTENLAGNLTTDPRAYFNSLSPADQAKTFGKANAEAIREGADIGKVVNAYRGTSTTALVTRATSRQKVATGVGPSVSPGHPDIMGGVRKPVPTGTGTLTPEGIYQTAGSRAEGIALLEQHGYLIRARSAPSVAKPVVTPKPQTPAPVAPRVADMTNADLETAMSDLMAAGNYGARLDEIGEELDRRATPPPRQELPAAPDPVAEQQALNRLLFGDKSVDDLAADRARKVVDPEKQLRDEYDTWVHTQWLRAEEECRGVLLTKRAEFDGINAYDLFSRRLGSLKHASPELQEWFSRPGNQRLSFPEFRAGVMDDKKAREALRRVRNRGFESEFG